MHRTSHKTGVICLLCTLWLFHPAYLPARGTLQGVVRCDSTGKPIAYAHLYSESQRTGTTSDASGFFNIAACPGDTLVVSSIGYHGKVCLVPDTLESLTIRLHAYSYPIEAIEIHGFRDYEDFKHQFLALQLTTTETARLDNYLREISRSAITEGELDRERDANYLHPLTGPEAAGGFAILWKEDRQRMRLAEIRKQDAKQLVIDKKYNRNIVQQVTHCPDEELTRFMVFCNFDPEVLYSATEYSILVLIEAKWNEFLFLKSKDQSELQPAEYAVVELPLC